MKCLTISSGEACFRLVILYWEGIRPFTWDGFGVYHQALDCWDDPEADGMAQDSMSPSLLSDLAPYLILGGLLWQ